MRRWVVILCAATLALPAFASNMGLALRLELWSMPEDLHYISLPYLYTPASAEFLCRDLLSVNGHIDEILRWDDSTSTFVEYQCGSNVGDFALEEGAGYGIRVALYGYVDALLVGRHDDGFQFDFAPGSGSNLHWISLPYHLALSDAGGQEGVVDSEDLCIQAGPELFSVMRWNEATGRFEAYLCGSEFADAFGLEQGVGYALVNHDGETVQWQPTHY